MTVRRSTRRISRDLGLSSSYLDVEKNDVDDSQCKVVVRDFLNSTRFIFTITSLICINAIMIGCLTDYMARHWTSAPPYMLIVCENVFCGIFVIEILLRIC